jgi:hypothetical protein
MIDSTPISRICRALSSEFVTTRSACRSVKRVSQRIGIGFARQSRTSPPCAYTTSGTRRRRATIQPTKPVGTVTCASTP